MSFNQSLKTKNLALRKMNLNKEVKCNLGVSKIHGVGVFAIRDISKGEELFESSTEYIKVDLDELNPEVRRLILDRTVSYNTIDFIVKHPNREIDYQAFMNHSDDPNSDGQTALRDILSGEEITEDYRHQDMALVSREHFSFLNNKC